MMLTVRFKTAVRRLKQSIAALYHALRDARTPWPARVLGAVTLAYALSPIDLIPDFIPVLGLLDDIILVPAGLWLTWRLVPEALRQEYMARAAAYSERLPQSRTAAVVIVLLWVLAAVWIFRVLAA